MQKIIKLKNYTEKDALLDVDKVLENVKMDPVTKSPVFKFESKSALYDGVTQEINISKMISTNKFDPQGFNYRSKRFKSI